MSWQELGCRPIAADEYRKGSVSTLPQFLGITECGRGYIAKTPRDPASMQSTRVNTTIFDPWTNQKLCVTQTDTRYASDREVLSRSRCFLLQSRGMDGVVLRDLARQTEVVIRNNSDGCPQFAFNKARDTALIRTDHSGVVWDLATGTKRSTFQRARRALSFGFCDAEDRAKCLTVSDSIEIWNEEKDFREFVLGEGSRDARRYEGFQLSSDSRAIAVIESGLMAIWSLQDGSLLHTISPNHSFFRSSMAGGSALLQCELNMSLSNNSRWMLIYRSYQQDPLITWAEKWSSTLGRVLCTFLPNGEVSELVDLKTGKTWSGIPCTLAATFSDDDSRLLTFSEDGKYEWSVPPRRRRITTCAWAVIGGWGSLLAVL